MLETLAVYKENVSEDFDVANESNSICQKRLKSYCKKYMFDLVCGDAVDTKKFDPEANLLSISNLTENSRLSKNELRTVEKHASRLQSVLTDLKISTFYVSHLMAFHHERLKISRTSFMDF